MRPELSFDGHGINGPDKYRSRVATFTNSASADAYGKQFAAAPIMLAALKGVIHHNESLKDDYKISPSLIRQLEIAIAAAT